MAWHSGGESNTELVDNLVENGLISTSEIERGFRNVDRKMFIPKISENIAYSDQPLKEGNIHISAPHIYCSVLEALDLRPNSCLSFLNIGSGTGYLSCIAAEILGPRSLNVGIEIHEDVVQHSHASISKWRNTKRTSCGKRRACSMTSNVEIDQAYPLIEIIHGNGFEVSPNVGESITGFDRIYIGAAIENSHLPKIRSLLSQGGVLVGPVDDELVKIVRIGKRENEEKRKDERTDGNVDELEFTTQVFSSVRFAPLLQHPKMKTTIPAKVWNPSFHHLYPDSYKKSIMSLFLCSNAQYSQPIRPIVKSDHTNLAATLPRDVWMHIVSFTNRKWFETEQPQTEFLRKRICEEQALAATAQHALLDAQARCYAAERERDIYRHMARRWHARLQQVLQQRTDQSSSSSTVGHSSSSIVPLLMDRDEELLLEDSASRIMISETFVGLGGADDESVLEAENDVPNGDVENIEDDEGIYHNMEEDEDEVQFGFESMQTDSTARDLGNTDSNSEEVSLTNITNINNDDSDCTSDEGTVLNGPRQRRIVSISSDSL